MIKSLVFIFLIFSASLVYGQQTRLVSHPDQKFEEAIDYFQREQYSLAYPLLKELEQDLRPTDLSNKALKYQEVKYYALVCALKQNEYGSDVKAREYIDYTDNAPRTEMLSFHLGEYYFRKNNYALALTAYSNTNIEHLTNNEIADMKFHQGYAYFSQNEYTAAKPLLQSIAQSPSDPNYTDANYYYGLISFREKNYNEALRSLSVAEADIKYKNQVGYYISTINYNNNDKEKALNYLEQKLSEGGQTHEMEMRQLTGHAYFERGEYQKAIPHLEAYINRSDKVKREDLYELSFSYYQTGQLPKAIEGFKQLSGREDSLSQNAMYLLGDAYLKTGDKNNARNAFLFCSLNSSNEVQKEISLFNYAKLSYELGHHDVALNEFQKFLDAYPASIYAGEARDLLVGVFANTSNYREAMELLSQISDPSVTTRRLIPGIYYGRATELINDGMLVSANELLTRAENLPDNQSVLPFIHFWKGEIAYRLENIDDAITYLYAYLRSGASSGEANVKNARYILAYALLKKENYNQALGFFAQVHGTPSHSSTAIEQDAYLRAADCYYMMKNYSRASQMYGRVQELAWQGTDYATYQRGMIAGVTSSRNKINEMVSLVNRFPNSHLIDEANMEIANTYMADENFSDAIPFLKRVTLSDNESLKPRAFLRIGLAYFNIGNNNEAIENYKTLLTQFPNSPEASEALENAQVIFVNEGRSGEYVAFARSLGKEISSNQEDDLAYSEAEVQMNNGNFSAAISKFEDYLKRFPGGAHVLEALYYKSEIYLSRKEWAKAAEGYEQLADRVPHKFAEKSLTQAARLNFFDLKNYEKAETYFQKMRDFASTEALRLEAMRGLLRSQYQLGKWDIAVPNAKDLLEVKTLSADDQILANLILAKSAQLNDQCPAAITHYRTVANLSKGEYGAEARYEIANCQFSMNNYTDAEKSAFEVINKSGSYAWWVTKSYILLGDIYFAQKDFFNAKATFQSIVDNAGIEELRLIASSKLEQVINEEKKNSKLED